MKNLTAKLNWTKTGNVVYKTFKTEKKVDDNKGEIKHNPKLNFASKLNWKKTEK